MYVWEKIKQKVKKYTMKYKDNKLNLSHKLKNLNSQRTKMY